MFSDRTRWSLVPNPLAAALEERRGRSFIDLTISNPAVAGLAFPDPAGLRMSLSDARVLDYRPEPFGRVDAREPLAAWLSGRGLEIGATHLCLTASTSEAYSFLFKLLCNPGDAVLVPTPSYPLFEYLAGLEGVALRPYPLRYDGEWHVNLPALDAALESGPGRAPRAIVAIHPNNPTGSYLKPDELDALVHRCAARGIALISDEVFYEHRLVEGGSPAPRAASRSECLTFSLGGLSKLAALPQLKLGWIAANGPEPLCGEALARLEIIADTYLSVSASVQIALPAILAQADAAVHAVGARLRANLAALDKALVRGPQLSRLRCEGGWTAVLRLPAVRSSEEWALHLLEQADVLVQPGYFYGLGEDGADAYVVLSLLCGAAPFSIGAAAVVGGASGTEMP